MVRVVDLLGMTFGALDGGRSGVFRFGEFLWERGVSDRVTGCRRSDMNRRQQRALVDIIALHGRTAIHRRVDSTKLSKIHGVHQIGRSLMFFRHDGIGQRIFQAQLIPSTGVQPDPLLTRLDRLLNGEFSRRPLNAPWMNVINDQISVKLYSNSQIGRLEFSACNAPTPSCPCLVALA